MGRFYRWLVSGTCLDRSPTVQFCEPWSVHTVQTVALFQALKRCRSISFFPPYTASFGAYSLNKFNPKNKNHSQSLWNPHLTLLITLCPFLTLLITLSSLPLSFVTVTALPRSLSHPFNHSLIFAFLPHRRRSSAQIATHSLNTLCLSPSSQFTCVVCMLVALTTTKNVYYKKKKKLLQ